MTYSIVAVDPKRGLLGIAGQSHHFAVGAALVAARPGVAVMAVQSYGDVDHYKPLVFGAVASGVSAEEALTQAHIADPRGRRTQVGLATSGGAVAAVTGSACVAAAGHVTGGSFAAQANMCAGPEVWEEAAAAYSTTEGDMAACLLAGLAAAEAAGGDLRGRQSAVIRVFAEPGAPPSVETQVDIRVDDHRDPVEELRRLDAIRRAKWAMSEAFTVAASGDVDAAISQLQDAQVVYGDNLEPSIWSAVLLARSRRFAEAKSIARPAVESRPQWGEFLSHLPDAGLLPDDPETIAMIHELRDE